MGGVVIVSNAREQHLLDELPYSDRVTVTPHTPSEIIAHGDLKTSKVVGRRIGDVALPEGSSIARTDEMLRKVAKIAQETDGVAHTISFPGLNALQFTNTPNTGVAFIPLKPFNERHGRTAAEINAEINQKIAGLQEGFAFAMMPPPILGLGNGNGYQMFIEDRGNLGYGNGYGSTDGNDNLMPFWKNFRAGGVESVRGFSSNTIGPRAVMRRHSTLPGSGDVGSGTGIALPSEYDTVEVSSNSLGGNALAAATVELFVPTPFLDESYNSSVRTSLFFDVGNVWDTEFNYDAYSALGADEFAKLDDYSDPARIRYAAGISVQWYSPMGPMIFSLAKPLKEYQYDENEVFGFTVGRTF